MDETRLSRDDGERNACGAIVLRRDPLLDAAQRYASILDTIDRAEALRGVFARVGVPSATRELISVHEDLMSVVRGVDLGDDAREVVHALLEGDEAAAEFVRAEPLAAMALATTLDTLCSIVSPLASRLGEWVDEVEAKAPPAARTLALPERRRSWRPIIRARVVRRAARRVRRVRRLRRSSRGHPLPDPDPPTRIVDAPSHARRAP